MAYLSAKDRTTPAQIFHRLVTETDFGGETQTFAAGGQLWGRFQADAPSPVNRDDLRRQVRLTAQFLCAHMGTITERDRLMIGDTEWTVMAISERGPSDFALTLERIVE